MDIKIKGAREHNLKNISLNIPRNKVVVFTGVSGSGKSSLVFDTIYTEAKRQYIETLSAYARKRLPKLTRPEVDTMTGLSTPVVIDQKKMGNNPRSTVGTATEVYSYLRLLYSRCGTPTTVVGSRLFSFNSPEGACSTCKGLGLELVLDKDALIDWERSLDKGAIRHPEYMRQGRRWNILKASKLFDMDKKLRNYSEEELRKLLYSEQIQLATEEKNGFIQRYSFEGIVTGIMRRRMDKRVLKISHNGRDTRYFSHKLCSECSGSRLNSLARSVTVRGRTIGELSNMQLTNLHTFLQEVRGTIAKPVVKGASEIVSYLVNIGVGYLSLGRPVGTLSGGESQRVKMARQLGSTLIEQIYILDEPSIGLHPKDIGNLTSILKRLRDSGNSVLVVEHDSSVICSADHVVDIGPGAGQKGGRVVFEGTPDLLTKSKQSITGQYLRRKRLALKNTYRKPTGSIVVENASLYNLKNITVSIPTGIFVCVTGVAGSGKSTLISDIFVQKHTEAIVVDQKGVGKNVRSCPATYIGVFDRIRREFALSNGVHASVFSYNSEGQCKQCRGIGYERVDMHFLGDVVIKCGECKGVRYDKQALTYRYKGKTIVDVLHMSAKEASGLFENFEIERRLKLLENLGLGYLQIGQPLSTLSCGEAQRIKLVSELHKSGSVYVFDEPTTGLHNADISKLLCVLNKLVDNGNTVIVIEHNLDVISQADWIIDMGPEGGDKGGEVVAEGTPKDISNIKKSYTGRYLRKLLQIIKEE